MKRAFSFWLAVICFAFCLCNPALSAQVAEPERYGYSLLTTDAQRTAYKAFASGISELKPQITFTISGITEENIQQIFREVEFAAKMVIEDYPEYFWYSGGYGANISGDTVTLTPHGYTVGGKTVSAGSAPLNEAKSKLEQAVSAALSSIPSQPSDYEIAHALHDYLIKQVDYQEVGDHQTAYGALVSGKAVCAGYAKAYQLLMNRAGIRCTYISGESFNPSGVRIPHAWNLVWLDGKCYYTDVTWDDQNSDVFHEYFNMSKEEMDKTHFADPSEIVPSGCHHDDYRFFLKNRGKGICDIHSVMDDSDIADCFELKSQNGNQTVYYCTVHYHGDDFHNWFSEHCQIIGNHLGYASCKISYIELGHEYHITYSGQLRPAETLPSQTAPTIQPTEATQPAPTTLPTVATQPAPTTQATVATQPAPTAKPPVSTQPAPTTQPTVAPEPTTAPTAPVSPTETPTQPSRAPESTQTTTQATDPTAPTQSTSASATEGTPATTPTVSTKPNQPESTETTMTTATKGEPSPTAPADEEEPGNHTYVIIVISVVLVLAAAGAAVFFVIRKKNA